MNISVTQKIEYLTTTNAGVTTVYLHYHVVNCRSQRLTFVRCELSTILFLLSLVWWCFLEPYSVMLCLSLLWVARLCLVLYSWASHPGTSQLNTGEPQCLDSMCLLMSRLTTADRPHKQQTQPAGFPDEILSSIKLSIACISVKNVEPLFWSPPAPHSIIAPS